MEPEAPELLDALLEPRDELFPGSVFPDPPFSGSVLSPSGSEPAFEGWRLPEDGGSKAEELLRLTVNPNVACGLGGRLASPGGHSSQVASPEPPRHDEAPAATAATTLYEVVCDLGTPLHGSVVSIQLATPDGGGEAAAGAGGGDAARHPAPHPGRGADPEEGAEKDPEQAVGPGQPAEEEGVPGRAGEQGGRVLSPKPGAAEENPGAGETQRVPAAAVAGADQADVQQGRPDQRLRPDPALLPGTHPLPQLQPLPPGPGRQPGRRQAHRSDFQEHPDPGGVAGTGGRSPVLCAGVAAGGRARTCGCRGGWSRGGARGREAPPRQGAEHQLLRPGLPGGCGGSETGTRGRDVTGSEEQPLFWGPRVGGTAVGGHPARPGGAGCAPSPTPAALRAGE
ncbi:cyclic AMP-responsive element-binding protein 3-like protein 4 isoform X1 [Mycteria americana]|uniref:cyclic AMP-responsive element-binding protein 3-like protein 4 isoform X1 n=1 Tax=Mycteria americana TaxID=33587 RepID=UPI003F580E3B